MNPYRLESFSHHYREKEERPLQLNDAAAHRNGDCLGTIGRAQLFHEVLNVHFHSLFG